MQYCAENGHTPFSARKYQNENDKGEMDMNFSRKVAAHACDSYDEERLAQIIRTQMDIFGYDKAFFAGKKVVIKPNLVMKKTPDAAATTNPVILSALLTVLSERACIPLIAESPGGLFNKQRLEGIYRVCGIE